MNRFSIAVVALAALGGCDSLQCGPGTYETGGYCLPEEGGGSDTEVTEGTPTADAGDDQNVMEPGTAVELDGSGSFDPDGDTLTYSWSLKNVPPGSKSTIDDDTAEITSFTPDMYGLYEVFLTVSDGGLSASDSAMVMVGENTNTPPTADAGEDSPAEIGETVQLDATGSSDPDGDTLTYNWFLATPKGSSATLDDSTSATPTFVPDMPGNYAGNLQVSDGIAQGNDVVIITVEGGGGGSDTEVDTENDPPTANAGADQTVSAGDTITLDASGSRDPEGDPLTYRWKITRYPTGSSVTSGSIADRDASVTTVTTDEVGSYTFQVRVSDGEFEDTDSVDYEAE